MAIDVQAFPNRFVRLDFLSLLEFLLVLLHIHPCLSIKAREYSDPHLLVLKDTM